MIFMPVNVEERIRSVVDGTGKLISIDNSQEPPTTTARWMVMMVDNAGFDHGS